MEELEFILQGTSFPVKKLAALQSCDALAHRLHGNQFFVESDVTGDVLRLFISAVHGEEIELTNKNIDKLSDLCDELQFLSLSHRLEVFKNTPTYRFGQRFNTLEANLQSLQSDVGTLTRKVTSLEKAQQSMSFALTRLQESFGNQFEAKLRLFAKR
jgi:hypothetical protein